MSENRINFTKKTIEGILPSNDGKLTYYWDMKTRGLFLLVTGTGIKTFYVRRKIKGKSERLLLGRFPELSIEQARAKASEFHAELNYGRNLSDERRLELKEFTLGLLFHEYMERHARKTRRGWKNIQAQFSQDFDCWRNRKLSSITTDDVERLHMHIAETRGRYAANRALELLRAIFNKGRIWKLFRGDNPAGGISSFPEEARTRILQPDEFERFFRALNTFQDEQFKDFIMLCLLTGARKSNVLSMAWKDISFHTAVWKIPADQSKNCEEQLVALTPAEVEILRKRFDIRKNDFVFFGEGRTGHFVEPKRAWTNLLQQAKIDNLHLHDLRRSLASWMANTGANASLIRSALNHKDIKTTLTVYAHTVRDAERSARAKAHEFMLSHQSI